MPARKLVVYIDDSKQSTEVLKALRHREEEFTVVYCSGPSDRIPAVETRTSLIEGYDNVCRYVLRNGS